MSQLTLGLHLILFDPRNLPVLKLHWGIFRLYFQSLLQAGHSLERFIVWWPSRRDVCRWKSILLGKLDLKVAGLRAIYSGKFVARAGKVSSNKKGYFLRWRFMVLVGCLASSETLWSLLKTIWFPLLDLFEVSLVLLWILNCLCWLE